MSIMNVGGSDFSYVGKVFDAQATPAPLIDFVAGGPGGIPNGNARLSFGPTVSDGIYIGAGGANAVQIQAPTGKSTVIMLPDSPPQNNDMLSSDGSGNWFWTHVLSAIDGTTVFDFSAQIPAIPDMAAVAVNPTVGDLVTAVVALAGKFDTLLAGLRTRGLLASS